jgi:hypothetical protein
LQCKLTARAKSTQRQHQVNVFSRQCIPPPQSLTCLIWVRHVPSTLRDATQTQIASVIAVVLVFLFRRVQCSYHLGLFTQLKRLVHANNCSASLKTEGFLSQSGSTPSQSLTAYSLGLRLLRAKNCSAMHHESLSRMENRAVRSKPCNMLSSVLKIAVQVPIETRRRGGTQSRKVEPQSLTRLGPVFRHAKKCDYQSC